MEDDAFFVMVESLRREDLIDLIASNSNESDFISKALEADDFNMDRIGENVARMAEVRSGAMVFKGAVFMKASMWRRLKNEMNILLCTKDKKYASLRKQLSKESSSSHVTIVSMIAAAVSAEMGVVPGLLVPLVALTLVSVLKVSKEAYCSGTLDLQP